jgi:hypothetical protein
MSRSYKKNPVTTNSGSSFRKFAKNQANRRIRKTKEMPDGKFFKKLYSSWDICDYKCFWTGESLWWPYWRARMK